MINPLTSITECSACTTSKGSYNFVRFVLVVAITVQEERKLCRFVVCSESATNTAVSSQHVFSACGGSRVQ